MPSPPVASIIIPGYNRIGPLKYTLRSVAAAVNISNEPIEVLLVDDGSSPPLAHQLGHFDAQVVIKHLRQPNTGSIFARLTGLAAAQGTYILFLDSDDLIHPDKLKRHLSALRSSNADVSYDGKTKALLHADFNTRFYSHSEALPKEVTDPAELFIRVQPLPHGPLYRREWLRRALADPVIPAERNMDPVGDVWLYYNLAAQAAKITRIPAGLTAIGPHDQSRFSQHWERLGVAALLVVERFFSRCPVNPSTLAARQVAGEVAFESWRRLPYNFAPEFERRLLALWLSAPKHSGARLGGRGFNLIARLIGPVAAGRLLRRLRNVSYSTCRTLDDIALADLLATARPPKQ